MRKRRLLIIIISVAVLGIAALCVLATFAWFTPIEEETAEEGEVITEQEEKQEEEAPDVTAEPSETEDKEKDKDSSEEQEEETEEEDAAEAKNTGNKNTGKKNTGKTKDAEKGSDSGESEKQTDDEAEQDVTVTESVSGIKLPGYISLELPAETKVVTPGLSNPEENEGLYSLSFTLTVDGAEEPLFTTDYIKAGESTGRVTLSEPLEEGTYKAVLRIQPKRLEDGALTNNAEMAIELIVK